MLVNRIQQVTGTVTMNGRYRNRITQTQVIEFVEFRWNITDVIYFIYTKNNRFVALQQHSCNVGVGCSNAGFQVGNQNDHIGAVDCQLSLTAHLGQNDVIGIWLDTTGISQHNFLISPLTWSIDTVTGNARSVFYDRQSLTDQFIEQCGLTNVWTSYDCNHWFMGHGLRLLFFYL